MEETFFADVWIVVRYNGESFHTITRARFIQRSIGGDGMEDSRGWPDLEARPLFELTMAKRNKLSPTSAAYHYPPYIVTPKILVEYGIRR